MLSRLKEVVVLLHNLLAIPETRIEMCNRQILFLRKKPEMTDIRNVSHGDCDSPCPVLRCDVPPTPTAEGMVLGCRTQMASEISLKGRKRKEETPRR